MAGDWIAWCKGLSRKPEVLMIAKAAGRTRREVASTLMEFWEWADEQTTDGRIDGAGPKELADVIAGTDAEFWLAVQQAGWLVIDTSGIEIPRFSRWLGQSAKKRLNKNSRQARWRSPGEASVDVSASTQAPTKASRKAPTREPNQKEPEKIATQSSFLPAEPAGETEQPADHASAQPSEKPKNRERDELFDAIAELGGADPKIDGSRIGRVCKVLRSSDPPYTPADVRALPSAVAARGWNMTLSVEAIGKHIGLVRAPVPPKAQPPPRRGGKDRAEGFRTVLGGDTDDPVDRPAAGLRGSLVLPPRSDP